MDYISFYFLKYPRIERPEDHWPPLYSFFIAPFFLFMGKSALAAKLPNLIISSLLFPLVGYFLGRSLSGNRVVGLATALHIIVYPAFFTSSLFSLSNLTFAFMVAAGVLFAVKGLEKPRYFYLMGLCLGLAYYAKGAGLVLIPAYVLFYIIWQRSLKAVFHDKPFLIGLLLTFLVLLPWFIRNTVHFRNPIFSTQQFVAGYVGYEDWETGTYTLYWGEKERPNFLAKLIRDPAFTYQMTKEYFENYLWWAFVDIEQMWADFQPESYHTYLTGIPAAFGLALLVCAGLYGVTTRYVATDPASIVNRRGYLSWKTVQSGADTLSKLRHWGAKLLAPWHNRKLHLVWFVGFCLFSFVSLWWWLPKKPLTFSVTALVIATGWTTYYVFFRIVFKSILSGFKRFDTVANLSKKAQLTERLPPLLIVLLTFFMVRHSWGLVAQSIEKSGYPYGDDGQGYIAAGKWLHANAPGSVTMTRSPWELHFYSEEKAVQVPLADLDQVIEVMQFYGVTHIIADGNRPALAPWFNGEIPGLELVFDQGLLLYQVHYDLLPDHLVSR